MKTKSTIVLFTVMALILAGCVGSKTGKINTASDLEGKVIGMINLSPSVKGMNLMVSGYIGAEPKEVIFFNRTSDLIAAIITGKIDAGTRPKFIVDYYAKRNNNLIVIAPVKKTEGVIFMALRSEDQQLRDDLDKAITVLQENGVMKALEDQWVTNLPVSNEPSNIGIAKIEGAKTVYVGVSGDFAPIDYIAANGRPAGYNVALLSEIGKMLKINFEYVSIDTPARFLALSSKKIDVIFCALENKDVAFTLDLRNNSWIQTKPYFTFVGGYFLVKK